MCWYTGQGQEEIKQIVTNKPVLFSCLPLFDLLLLKNCIWSREKLVRIVTCSPFRAHTEPLIVANRIFNVYDISAYVTGTLMYEYMCGDASSSLHDFFQTNSDIHSHDTRYSNHIHVPYGRLDIRRFSFKISGANLWNSLPDMLKNPTTLICLKGILEIICLITNEMYKSPKMLKPTTKNWYDCLLTVLITHIEAQWKPHDAKWNLLKLVQIIACYLTGFLLLLEPTVD